MAARTAAGRCLGWALLLWLAAGLHQTAKAAPVGFDSALPVAAGQSVLRLLAVAERSELGGTTLHRRGTQLTVVHGLHPRVAVLASLPIATTRSADQAAIRSASGAGDLRLTGRGTLWRQDRPGETRRLGLLLDLTLPTGRDPHAGATDAPPRALPPGDDTWRLGGGLVATWQTLSWQLDAQARYRRGIAETRLRQRDRARLDVSGQKVLLRLGSRATPAFVYGVLESGFEHLGDGNLPGRREGGDWAWIAPGLQWVSPRLVLELRVRWPLFREMRRDAARPERALQGGIRVQF